MALRKEETVGTGTEHAGMLPLWSLMSLPLIVFSHYSGGHRRSATFLCTHLASHGYVVAVLDHSEVSRRNWPTVTAQQKRNGLRGSTP